MTDPFATLGLPLLWWLLATFALAAGPLLEPGTHARPLVRQALDGWLGGLLAALVVLHVLVDAAEALGPAAWLLGLAGLVLPTIAKPGTTAWLVVAGLSLHALVDGAALGMPPIDGASDHAALALAVVVHRLPVGIIVWTLAGGGQRGWLALLGVTVVTGLGLVLGPHVEHLDGLMPIAGFQALVGGSLVHILLEKSPLAPAGDLGRRGLLVDLLAFALGAAITTALPEHAHENEGSPWLAVLALSSLALARRAPRAALLRWRG